MAKKIESLLDEQTISNPASRHKLRMFRDTIGAIEDVESSRNTWVKGLTDAGVGSYALHYAVAAECPKLADAILQSDQRADPTLQNLAGKSTLALADSSKLPKKLKTDLQARATSLEARTGIENTQAQAAKEEPLLVAEAPVAGPKTGIAALLEKHAATRAGLPIPPKRSAEEPAADGAERVAIHDATTAASPNPMDHTRNNGTDLDVFLRGFQGNLGATKG